MAVTVGAIVSIASFLLFQIYPREILRLFGNGTKEYFDFGIRYFRVFLLFTWLNFMQPISSTFFSSIGKAYKGTFLSLTRQILFLLPLMLIFPHFFGIMGVLYASPVADLLSFAVGLGMVIQEFRYINRLELEASASPPAQRKIFVASSPNPICGRSLHRFSNVYLCSPSPNASNGQIKIT